MKKQILERKKLFEVFPWNLPLVLVDPDFIKGRPEISR